jgi:hypothetical protein
VIDRFKAEWRSLSKWQRAWEVAQIIALLSFGWYCYMLV